MKRQWCYPSLSCFWVRGLNRSMHNDKNSFVCVRCEHSIRFTENVWNWWSHSLHASLLKRFKDSDLNITLPYMIIMTRNTGHRHWLLTWKLLSQIWMCLWESGVTDESEDDKSDESVCCRDGGLSCLDSSFLSCRTSDEQVKCCYPQQSAKREEVSLFKAAFVWFCGFELGVWQLYCEKKTLKNSWEPSDLEQTVLNILL